MRSARQGIAAAAVSPGRCSRRYRLAPVRAAVTSSPKPTPADTSAWPPTSARSRPASTASSRPSRASSPRAAPMPDDNSRLIVHAANERHRTGVERVLEVLRRFDRDGTPITFVAVAAAASVSRPWLYREPTLRALKSCAPAALHPHPQHHWCRLRNTPRPSRNDARSKRSTKSSARSERTTPAFAPNSNDPSANNAWPRQQDDRRQRSRP